MARVADVQIFGLTEMMRDLRRLPKEASDEMRKSSQQIATDLMVPYWKAAAESAGPWGGRISSTVRAKRDRIPSVSIGSNRRAFSGGASPTAVRYPSHAGGKGRAGAAGTLPPAFGDGFGWMRSMGKYKPEAVKKWLEALDRVKRKFERG
jgi:hypothetical protein